MLELYPPRGGEVGGKSGSMTVSNKFLGQLTSLVAMLKESSTRFVRCIKTNEQKVPSTIDKPSVLRQLVCSGVMAALEVRRAGFPTRVTYKEVEQARVHRVRHQRVLNLKRRPARFSLFGTSACSRLVSARPASRS